MKKLGGRIAGALVPLALALAACTPEPPPPRAPEAATAAAPCAVPLPAQLAGKAVPVAADDPDAARADLASAIKVPGQGALAQGIVVRLLADVPVWRMWSGPEKKDASGRTNRMGQWWAYDAP